VPRTLIGVNEQGRVTLPAEVRRRLGIRAGSQLEVKVEENGIRLRPATVIPEADRWAYTPEAIASLKRGLADLKAGRVYQLTEDELLSGKLPRRAGRRRR
jgi:AbrB family looped-hinge helix DNA binding protein